MHALFEKLLVKYVIIIYALGCGYEKFGI